jgi:hypothetical protein
MVEFSVVGITRFQDLRTAVRLPLRAFVRALMLELASGRMSAARIQ